MFVGDKGKILAGFRVESPRLIPERRMSGYPAPAAAARAPREPGQLSAGPAPVGGGLQGRRAIARKFPACRRNFGGGESVRGCTAHAPPPVLRRGESQDHQRAGSQQISFARIPQGLESRIDMNFNRRQFLGAASLAALAAARVLARRPAGHADRLPDMAGPPGSGQGFRGHAARARPHRLQDHRNVLAGQLRGFPPAGQPDGRADAPHHRGRRTALHKLPLQFQGVEGEPGRAHGLRQGTRAQADGARRVSDCPPTRRSATTSRRPRISTASASARRRPESNWAITTTTTSSKRSTAY